MTDRKDENFRKVGMVSGRLSQACEGTNMCIPRTKHFITASLQPSFQLHPLLQQLP
jgi:hypothetical protein